MQSEYYLARYRLLVSEQLYLSLFKLLYSACPTIIQINEYHTHKEKLESVFAIAVKRL